MDFNLAEQMAVLKSVDTIMRSDDRVYEGEARFLTQLASVLPVSAAQRTAALLVVAWLSHLPATAGVLIGGTGTDECSARPILAVCEGSA